MTPVAEMPYKEDHGAKRVSLARRADAMATRKAVFQVRNLSDASLNGSKGMT